MSTFLPRKPHLGSLRKQAKQLAQTAVPLSLKQLSASPRVIRARMRWLRQPRCKTARWWSPENTDSKTGRSL